MLIFFSVKLAEQRINRPCAVCLVPVLLTNQFRVTFAVNIFEVFLPPFRELVFIYTVVVFLRQNIYRVAQVFIVRKRSAVIILESSENKK